MPRPEEMPRPKEKVRLKGKGAPEGELGPERCKGQAVAVGAFPDVQDRGAAAEARGGRPGTEGRPAESGVR